MKASTVIAIATGLTASLVSAQLEAIPPCALTCAISSLGSTGCDTADIACICKANGFIAMLLPCVQEKCDAALIQDTIKAASELCAGAGVTLSIPTGAPTSAPDTSATSAPTDATTTLSTAVSTETSAPGTETTAAPTTGPTSSANGTISTTGSQPPSPTQTGSGSSASRNTVALGGLGAVLALVAALL